jgi:hypothetical protein
MTRFVPLVLAFLASSALAYDVNGVKLGGREIEVKSAFPSVHCKQLEWRTEAADRRCDDARIALGGAGGPEARVTFYLKAGVIRAIDLRFDTRDLEKVKAILKTRWGAPLAEATETIGARSKDQKDRKVHKMRWERGEDRAILSAQLEKKRASIEVARGNFFDEVYRVK